MKYQILHDFRTPTPFKEKSSDHFKDLYKLKLLTNFNVNLTSFLGGVINYNSCVICLIHNYSWPRCQIDIKICLQLQFMRIIKMTRGFFFKWSISPEIMQNWIFHVKL